MHSLKRIFLHLPQAAFDEVNNEATAMAEARKLKGAAGGGANGTRQTVRRLRKRQRKRQDRHPKALTCRFLCRMCSRCKLWSVSVLFGPPLGSRD